jgi:hypothetical protein
MAAVTGRSDSGGRDHASASPSHALRIASPLANCNNRFRSTPLWLPSSLSLALSMRDCQAWPMADSRALLILTLHTSSAASSVPLGGYSNGPPFLCTLSAASYTWCHPPSFSPFLSLRNSRHLRRKPSRPCSFALAASSEFSSGGCSSSPFTGSSTAFGCSSCSFAGSSTPSESRDDF